MSDNKLVKTPLLFFKFYNLLFGDSSFKDEYNYLCKKFDEYNRLCKKFDEIEQFVENNPEIKNFLEEFVENNPEIKILLKDFVEEAVLTYKKTFFKAAEHL